MKNSVALSACLLTHSMLSAGAHAQSAALAPAVNVGDQDSDSGESATDLAKKLQNPIGDLYSFPFQNNTNFNTGPNKGTQDILNIQPIHINEDWNVITRTILPLIWQPSLKPPGQVEATAGDELVAAAHAWVDRWPDAGR
jgi:hypothetical protein